MFREGDKVVCIDNSARYMDMRNYMGVNPLKLYTTYTVDKVIYGEHDYNNQVVVGNTCFNVNRFISITDYRKRKLEKICFELKIK